MPILCVWREETDSMLDFFIQLLDLLLEQLSSYKTFF